MKKFDVRKILTIFLVAAMASVIAGIYGVINDQITFSISSEYYTKFKFIQFNLANENNIDKIKFPRIFVAIVGFLATWWFGLVLGFILGFFNLIQTSWQNLFKVSFNALLIAIFGYSLALVLQNPTELPVDLLFTQVPAMRLGLLLLLTLVLGVIVGLLLGVQVFRVFQTNWEIKRLRKDIDHLRKEQIQVAQQAAAQAAASTRHEKTVLDIHTENKSPL